MIQHLRKKNVPADRIMKLTGQNNIKSIMAYDSPDEEEQAGVSRILSGLHGCIGLPEAASTSSSSTNSLPTAQTPVQYIGQTPVQPTALSGGVPQPAADCAMFNMDFDDDDLDGILAALPLPQDLPLPLSTPLPVSGTPMFQGAVFNGPVHFNINIAK